MEDAFAQGLQYRLKYSAKILIIGEAGVGKTAIIQKYVNNFYPEMYKQSLGCNFFSKKLELPKDISVNLTIWDCSSESLKSKMLKTYVFESDAVLFVYDITNKSSFDAIPNLVKLVKSVLADRPSTEYAVLGNKKDLFNQIAVEEETAIQLCKALELPFFSVSAKIGANLNESFKQLAYKICKIPYEEKKATSSINSISEGKQSSIPVPDISKEVSSSNSSSSSGCAVF